METIIKAIGEIEHEFGQLQEKFRQLRLALEQEAGVQKKREELPDGVLRMLRTNIADCGLSVRLYNVLNRNGVRTVADLAATRRPWWIRQRGFGKKTLRECDAFLEKAGIRFGMSAGPYGIPLTDNADYRDFVKLNVEIDGLHGWDENHGASLQ